MHLNYLVDNVINNKTAFATVCVLSSTSLFATEQNITHGVAYNGFTGLFNTPSAEVLKAGEANIGYTNQLEKRGSYNDGHNFTFAAGLLQNLEVAGRITASSMNDNLFSYENKGQIRDLSFNAKYQVPYIPKNWFSIALGAKDIGGAANNYEAYYLVASKEWWDFRFSAGIGQSDTLTGQLDGAFAGIEYQPLSWLSILAEHDAEAFNMGARITIPKEYLYNFASISINSRLYSNTDLSEKDNYWGININIPLSDEAQANYTNPKPAPEPVQDIPAASANIKSKATITKLPSNINASPTQQIPSANQVNNSKHVTKSISNESNKNYQLHSLKNNLINDGFENIRVGISETDKVIVEFENSVFNRNEIDAIGLVIGRITEHFAEQDNEFIVRLSKLDTALLQVRGKVDNYQRFLEENITPDLQISNQFSIKEETNIIWAESTENSSPYLVPRVTFSPSYAAHYATELGVWDYSLALQADLNIPIWKGAGINLTGQIHVTDSDDFEEGEAFSSRRKETGLTRAIAYQTFALPYGFYNQTQFGLFQDYFDYIGLTNETAWLSPTGRHKLKAKFAVLEYKDYDTRKRDYALASYRYLWAEKDVSFHVTGGRFWNDDSGYKLEAKFWFGDANLSLIYSNTDVQKVGLGFSIPLAPRKDMTAGNWQIKGDNSWSQTVSTVVGNDVNLINTASATTPASSIDLDKTFLNQDRMSSSYVYAHLARLKEAFETYK
ncbi:YjbH domain-containing protein [Pseudoalteromonas sp. SaAl2]